VRRRPLASRFPLSTLLAVVLLLAIGWGTGELELRIEQSDNDSDLVVRNDSGETIVVPLLRAAKVIHEVPLESDESWHVHPE
jgi:hypothetical protein